MHSAHPGKTAVLTSALHPDGSEREICVRAMHRGLDEPLGRGSGRHGARERAERDDVQDGSPLVVGEHVYVQAAAGFCKLDKQTGKVLWRILEDPGGMFGSAFSSPILSTLCGRPQLVVQTRQKLAGELEPLGEDGLARRLRNAAS